MAVHGGGRGNVSIYDCCLLLLLLVALLLLLLLLLILLSLAFNIIDVPQAAVAPRCAPIASIETCDKASCSKHEEDMEEDSDISIIVVDKLDYSNERINSVNVTM